MGCTDATVSLGVQTGWYSVLSFRLSGMFPGQVPLSVSSKIIDLHHTGTIPKVLKETILAPSAILPILLAFRPQLSPTRSRAEALTFRLAPSPFRVVRCGRGLFLSLQYIAVDCGCSDGA